MRVFVKGVVFPSIPAKPVAAHTKARKRGG